VADWCFHPDPAVDVAVSRFWWKEEFDHVAFSVGSCLNEAIRTTEHIGVGNEVFFAGLFHLHYGQQSNLPIVRVGNIAAMPAEKIRTSKGEIDAYLIEARSIGGLSGLPVFISLALTRSIGGLALTSTFSPFYLVGVVQGHFDMQEGDVVDEFAPPEDALAAKYVNMGIAIVTPIEKVLEAIQTTKIAELDVETERAYREQFPT
jgi:hypothetical protein